MACYKIAGAHRLFYVEPYLVGGANPGAVVTTTTMNADSYIGDTGEEGIRLTRETLLQDITSDQLGKGIVDEVYQGANLTMEFVAQDVNREIVLRLLYPWQTSITDDGLDAQIQDYGPPGTMVCARMGVLVAFPVEDTPAYTADSGATGPFNFGSNGRAFVGINVGPVPETLDTTPRFIPVRFRCYPFYNTSTKLWKFWEWVSCELDPYHST
jgi:hypothetical protein